MRNPFAAFTVATFFLAGAELAWGQPIAYNWTVFAGQCGGAGFTNGTGSVARFNRPSGVAADSAGNIYIADTDNNAIRKVTPAGVVTTLVGGLFENPEADMGSFVFPSSLAVDAAGNVVVIGSRSFRRVTPAGVVTTTYFVSGSRAAMQISRPSGVGIDAAGNLYVTSSGQNFGAIYKVTPSGVASILAGGTAGTADGTGSAAQFSTPFGIAVDAAGTAYVCDSGSQRIRKVTAAGKVTTLAGSGNGFYDGTGSAAQFRSPRGIALDKAGNLFVCDTGNCAIRQITPTGVVTTVAGGNPGSADGTGTAAKFYVPSAVAVDSSGRIYVVDKEGSALRRITVGAVVTTFAGVANHSGAVDGTGTAAQFYLPNGLATDGAGNVYVADLITNLIRKVTAAGVVTTLAGDRTWGLADGVGSAAKFRSPNGVAVDAAGNVYVADYGNDRIRKITPEGLVTTLAGSGTPHDGKGGGTSSGYTDGPGATAKFKGPNDVAVDGMGNVYVADAGNARIRKITPAGDVTTLAGSTVGVADGTGAAAQFNAPVGLTLDSAGNLFVVDGGNSNRIRKVTPAGGVTTFAGSTRGSLDGTGPAARFTDPTKIASDASGNLYVTQADSLIRKITPAAVVTTIGGRVGALGTAEGVNTEALFRQPGGIAVSADGSLLYVANTLENVLLKAVATLVPSPIPVAAKITLKGGTKRVISGGAIAIKGTSSASVVRIAWKVGPKGKLRSSAAGRSWTITVKGLKPGANFVYVRGVTARKAATPFKKINIIRK